MRQAHDDYNGMKITSRVLSLEYARPSFLKRRTWTFVPAIDIDRRQAHKSYYQRCNRGCINLVVKNSLSPDQSTANQPISRGLFLNTKHVISNAMLYSSQMVASTPGLKPGSMGTPRQVKLRKASIVLRNLPPMVHLILVGCLSEQNIFIQPCGDSKGLPLGYQEGASWFGNVHSRCSPRLLSKCGRSPK